MGTDLVKLVQDHSTVELANGPNIHVMNELLEAKKQAYYWTNKLDTLKAELGRLMGDDEVALVHGQPIFTKIPIDRINETLFKKEEPELYEIYQHEVSKKELDTDLLKRARPDLYARFAVRPLKEV